MGHEEKNYKVLKLAEERDWECLFLVSLTRDERGLQPNLKTEKSNSFHKKEVLFHTMCDKIVDLTDKITKARPCFLITVWIWTVLMTFHFFFICTLSQPHEIFLICFYVGFRLSVCFSHVHFPVSGNWMQNKTSTVLLPTFLQIAESS